MERKKVISGLRWGRVGLSSGRVTPVLPFFWILTIPWNSIAHPTALKMSTLISSRAFISFDLGVFKRYKSGSSCCDLPRFLLLCIC